MQCGIEWNPRPLCGVDMKMYNYLVGAVLLALNVVSGVYVHYHERGTCSLAMIAYASCMTWFVADYMFFEHVHVYTYDIFRERTGFKMIWGCFCFYPYFYTVGMWPIVYGQPEGRDIHPFTCISIFALFLLGWTLTRGANMQKFQWRTSKKRTFLCGLIEQRTVAGSKNRILRSGFWSLARHVRPRSRQNNHARFMSHSRRRSRPLQINYFGEIVQGIALALPGFLATGSVLPLLYPAYYVALFVPRQIDDDKACAEKYGRDVWDRYCAAVRWRIVPGVW